MTDTGLLNQKIMESGYKKKFLAAQLGITYAGFVKKANNESDFTSREISKLCKLLGVKTLAEKDKIFFASE